MTGIERLRALAGAWDEWGLGGSLTEIADEIERELDRQDEPDSTGKGARLLYVTDEDREALEWVRKYGGIGCVQTMATTLGDTLTWIRERVGIGEDEVVDYDELLDAIDRRLMPEDIEWPRYESGELVQIGDDVIGRCGDDPIKVRSVEFRDGDIYLREGFKTDRVVIVYPGERVKRPVLASDGEPLEVGQTVWGVSNGIEFTVVGLPKSSEYQAVKLRLDDGSFTGLDPDQLTHQRPVLDADGVPIRNGDEVRAVWNFTGHSYVVEDASNPLEIAVRAKEYPDQRTTLRAKSLTHEKPEIDSWQRIEEDAGCTATKYNERRGTIFTTKQQVARDLVRRCRALAERERGE